MVSHSINNHKYFKQYLEGKGKKNVMVTDANKDGLNSIINDMVPDLLIMSARFYQCCTPYMMGLLKKKFHELNMAALCFDEYPADLGMYFIVNGVKSYFNMFEGIEQFNAGLAKILEGREFISEVVKERIKIRKDYPKAANKLPQKLVEVIRCICNGFKKYEIADNLWLSERTVENYREEIYRCLNVRNIAELYSAALELHFVTEEELVFRHRKFTVKPFPKKSKTKNEQRAKSK